MTHQLASLIELGDSGYYEASCSCGWTWAPSLERGQGRAVVIDALMQHAFDEASGMKPVKP